MDLIYVFQSCTSVFQKVLFVEVKYSYLCRWLRLFLCLHFLLLLELLQLFSLLSFLLQLGFCLWWAWRSKQRKSEYCIHKKNHELQHMTSWPLAVASAESTAGVALAGLALAAAFVFGVTGTIFSQRAIFPNTFRNCGWFMQVVNHLVTLVNTFLSDGSKT